MILCCLLWLSESIPISYIPQTGIPPSQRLYTVMDYYEPSDMLIVFSGSDNLGPKSDLWGFSFNTSYWEQIIPTDSRLPRNLNSAPRSSSSCFASKFTANFYIFGGLSSTGPLNDLWVYQIINLKWVPLQTTSAPPPRSLFGSTRFDDGVHEYFAVYGGSRSAGPDNHLFM